MATLASGWSKDEEKLIPKPSPFLEEAGKWNAWKWEVENWASVMHEDMSGLLEACATATDVIEVMTNPDHQKLNKLLYAVLGGLCKETAHPFFRNSGKKSGFEAWRKMVQRYEPQGQEGRALAWLQNLISVEFDKTSDRSWQASWVSWESNVLMYQQQTKKQFDSDLMKATLVRCTPEGPLKEHLQLHASSYPTYQAMKTAIEGWFKSRENWSQGVPQADGAAPVPMDVSAVWTKGKGKDKGKGKGKDKGKGKGDGKTTGQQQQQQNQRTGPVSLDTKLEGYCWNCNKWGHRKQECWAPPSNGSSNGSTTSNSTNTSKAKGKGKGKDGKGKGKGVNQVDAESSIGPSASNAGAQKPKECGAVFLEEEISDEEFSSWVMAILVEPEETRETLAPGEEKLVGAINSISRNKVHYACWTQAAR